MPRITDAFLNCKTIREDTPIDEWVLEEFWPLLIGDSEPPASSALAVAVQEGLQLRGLLDHMRLVWDDQRE